jgi:hypothetical protein
MLTVLFYYLKQKFIMLVCSPHNACMFLFSKQSLLSFMPDQYFKGVATSRQYRISCFQPFFVQ